MKALKTLLLIILLSLMFPLSGCGGTGADSTGGAWDEHLTGSMELKYADQFHVDYYDDGISVVTVEDGLSYLVTEDAETLPEWLPKEEVSGMTVITVPTNKVYNAASSAMDLIDAAGALDSVIMTSTQAGDWGIEKIRNLVEDGTIRYIGKYRAPDYEALLGDDVDLKQIAQTTAGFSGADLENLLNEAAIRAAKAGRGYILQEDIRAAFIKVGIGAEKRSKVISDKDKRITAYHEAGHAILFHVLPDVGPVYSVSIIPTGRGAAGYTMPLPETDELFNTRGRMLQNIIVALGGRVAEELVFDDVTTGASQDLKSATATAKAMVTKYGFSTKLGLVSYGSDDEVFIGRDFEKTRSYSERTADEIDSEIRDIIEKCYAEAKRLIEANLGVLEACAKLLLEKEKITRQEFEALFDEKTIPANEGAAAFLEAEGEIPGSEGDTEVKGTAVEPAALGPDQI